MNEQVCLLQTEIRADLQTIAQAYGELNRKRFFQFLGALTENPA
jgi:hypothetical protein